MILRAFQSRTCAIAVLVLALSGSASLAVLASPYGDSSSSAALRSASFHVLLPTALPAAAKLMGTDVRRHGDGSSDVDVFYRLADGSGLHIWESSRDPRALGPKNPLREAGEPIAGSRVTWLKGTGLSGRVSILTARIDGVIVSIDAPLPTSDLLVIADSLR